MSLYNVIYEFFTTYLFSSETLTAYKSTILGVETSLSSWLSHTATIIVICLFIAFLVVFIKWLFKVFSGLIRW